MTTDQECFSALGARREWEMVGEHLRVKDGNEQGQKMLYSCCGAGAKIEKLRGKEDPQTYLKARFSIMSLNEMSARKGRADKYGRVMVL